MKKLITIWNLYILHFSSWTEPRKIVINRSFPQNGICWGEGGNESLWSQHLTKWGKKILLFNHLRVFLGTSKPKRPRRARPSCCRLCGQRHKEGLLPTAASRRERMAFVTKVFRRCQVSTLVFKQCAFCISTDVAFGRCQRKARKESGKEKEKERWVSPKQKEKREDMRMETFLLDLRKLSD